MEADELLPCHFTALDLALKGSFFRVGPEIYNETVIRIVSMLGCTYLVYPFGTIYIEALFHYTLDGVL